MSEFMPSQRQSKILEMLAIDGFVSTDDMVTHFKVTPQTIRRDLNELKLQELLTRFHGGAGQIRGSDNRPYKDRLNSRVEAKQQIAKKVASLIPDGASLFLNTGTTIEAIARELLSHKSLKIFTNNIHVAQILNENETFNINVAGGQVRNPDGGIIGVTSVEAIKQFYMEYGIVGTNSIDEEGVLWDFDQLEVRIAMATIKNSQHSILVADHHKFRGRAMHRMGHISEFDVMVTDALPGAEFNKLLESSGIKVISSDE